MIASLERAAALTVSRETFGRISVYADMLIAESSKQNLISTKSLGHLWDRHILDAAQLIRFAEQRDSTWADIGAGAGLPGIVIACFDIGPVTLIEPRRLRAQFLNDVIDKLALPARVIASKAEKAKLYGQISEILYADIVKYPIVHSKPMQAKRANLEGWVLSPLGSAYLAEMSVK